MKNYKTHKLGVSRRTSNEHFFNSQKNRVQPSAEGGSTFFSSGNRPVAVQPKLTIGSANDKYEREADDVAQQVMRMHDTAQPAIQRSEIQHSAIQHSIQRPPTLQRQCERCDEASALKRTLESNPKQSQAKEFIQGKDANDGAVAPASVSQVLDTSGHSLDTSTRGFMESRFGHDFSHVRVHNDSSASNSAKSISAKAYTSGSHIVFGAGQYKPGSYEGKTLLAHELTHVVQQGSTNKNPAQKVQKASSPQVIKGTIQRQTEDTQQECTDDVRAAQTVAPSLMADGQQGGTFNQRLSRSEEAHWAGLSDACRRNSENCSSERNERLSRLHGRVHAAMDAPAAIGTAVFAPIAGTVLIANAASLGSGYGNNVLLQHDCPPHTQIAGNRAVTSFYAHLDSMSVSVGQHVSAGAQIGTVGITGRGAGRVRRDMAAHLHFSVQALPRRGGATQGTGRQHRFRGSRYEERRDIRIHPGRWLRQLGVAVVPPIAPVTPTVTPAATPTAIQTPTPTPTSNAQTVRRQIDISGNGSRLIQRVPEDGIDSPLGGGTLPYASAQELHDCTTILGSGSEAFCWEEVMGPPPVLNSAPPTILDAGGAGVVQFTTASGNFFRFPAAPTHTNFTDRPRFQHPQSSMVAYTGAANNGSATVRPEVHNALNRMMSALRNEGDRLNDESLKQAIVSVGYRPPTAHEGALYLAALRRTIARNSSIFGSVVFPSALETMAQSNLGFSGSTAHRAFRAAVAAQPGWNTNLARQLVDITGGFKAPRGGSTHHSGLVVDINFPFATSNTSVQWHGVDRNRNADALRAAAGVWLSQFSTNFDFDSYNTAREIWHMEWRHWGGSTADPATP